MSARIVKALGNHEVGVREENTVYGKTFPFISVILHGHKIFHAALDNLILSLLECPFHVDVFGRGIDNGRNFYEQRERDEEITEVLRTFSVFEINPSPDHRDASQCKKKRDEDGSQQVYCYRCLIYRVVADHIGSLSL
jgi:hypothetical protein